MWTIVTIAVLLAGLAFCLGYSFAAPTKWEQFTALAWRWCNVAQVALAVADGTPQQVSPVVPQHMGPVSFFFSLASLYIARRQRQAQPSVVAVP